MNRKDEVPKKDSKTQVVKLDKAFKLVIISSFNFRISDADHYVCGLV